MKKHMMIVFDLEWNGGWGKVKLNEVLQIGAVKLARLGGPVVDSFRAFVKPVVHKKLNRAAKGLAFSAGELDVLVATTVIEVGVDVPKASLMVIEHAERFGLAQLHQLRGRVGRGSAESVCILIYAQPLSQTGRERLKVIYENTDGFEIARADLRIRGPGEFVGARQSGLPLLRYASLEEDAALIDPARALAERMLRELPAATEGLLQRWLGGREALLRA